MTTRGGAVRRALPWLVPVLILLAWQGGSELGWIRATVLPAPTDVALAGWQLLLSGELIRNVEVSAWRAGVGFAIGGGIGFGLGCSTGCPTSARSCSTPACR